MLKVHLQISSLAITLLATTSSNQVVILELQGKKEKDLLPLLFAAASELKKFSWESYKDTCTLLERVVRKSRPLCKVDEMMLVSSLPISLGATFCAWEFFRWYFLPHWQNTLFSSHLISCTMNRQTFRK